jgi:hypothetical protein
MGSGSRLLDYKSARSPRLPEFLDVHDGEWRVANGE